jgi:hypothetical protein
MGRARDAILDALENLSGDELKKFKMKLLTVQLREGYGRIPRGALLQMDAIDLTDKLVSYYLESYGLELTMTVLRDMGLQELAEQLQTTKEGECVPLFVYPQLPAHQQRLASLALNCSSCHSQKKKKKKSSLCSLELSTVGGVGVNP